LNSKTMQTRVIRMRDSVREGLTATDHHSGVYREAGCRCIPPLSQTDRTESNVSTARPLPGSGADAIQLRLWPPPHRMLRPVAPCLALLRPDSDGRSAFPCLTQWPSPWDPSTAPTCL